MRRICNRYNAIIVSLSGGKDSTVSLELLRKELIARSPDINGNFTHDYNMIKGDGLFFLEEPNFNQPMVIITIQDPEIIYSTTRDYLFRTCINNSYGVFKLKENGQIIGGFEKTLYSSNYYDCLYLDYLNGKLNEKHIECLVPPSETPMFVFYKCLPIGYSNVVLGNYTSWDMKNDKFHIYDIPTKEQIGFDPYEEYKIQVNPIADSLFRNDIIYNPNLSNDPFNFGFGTKQFDHKIFTKKEVTAPWSYKGQDCEADRLSECSIFSNWLVNRMRPDVKVCNLVSIRMQESLDRYRILKKCDPGLPIYSRNTNLENE